mgnify:CR=1 FL=1
MPIPGTIPMPEWQTGEPPRDGTYYAKIRIDENTVIRNILYYREKPGFGSEKWHMTGGYPIHEECEVLAWWPVPED